MMVLPLFSPVSVSADTVAMQVRDTTGVARTREVVRSGIPLPRSLNVTRTHDGTALYAGVSG